MWKFKSCPRCKGDIFIDRDYSYWFEHCLQCGYRNELNGLDKANILSTRKSKNNVNRTKLLTEVQK